MVPNAGDVIVFHEYKWMAEQAQEESYLFLPEKKTCYIKERKSDKKLKNTLRFLKEGTFDKNENKLAKV